MLQYSSRPRVGAAGASVESLCASHQDSKVRVISEWVPNHSFPIVSSPDVVWPDYRQQQNLLTAYTEPGFRDQQSDLSLCQPHLLGTGDAGQDWCHLEGSLFHCGLVTKATCENTQLFNKMSHSHTIIPPPNGTLNWQNQYKPKLWRIGST